MALDYDYSNIIINYFALNFNQVCNLIKKYFKKADYKQSVSSKYIKLTFLLVIIENKSKPIKEYP